MVLCGSAVMPVCMMIQAQLPMAAVSAAAEAHHWVLANDALSAEQCVRLQQFAAPD